MIDILNHNLSFYRFLRNNKRTIESFDIDSGFASVIDYLNDVIVPAVNDMQAGALPGIMGNSDYFLTNVGDGSVTWNTLDKVILDNTLAFTKIEQSISRGKVLVSNNVGNLGLVTNSQYDNMVLAYRQDNTPIYKYITTENIEDRAITYADISDGAITNEHLSQEIIDILDSSQPDEVVTNSLLLTGNQFKNKSITTDQVISNTLNSELKLGIINNTLPLAPPSQEKIIRRTHVKNGTITPNKVRLGTIGALHFNKVQCIIRNKLAPNIIDDSFLRLKGEVYNIFDISNSSRFWFHPRILSPDFLIKREHLKVTTTKSNHCCRANDFEDVVRDAFYRFGCK
jgi:hypothetical protein